MPRILALYLGHEVTTLNIPIMAWPFIAAFWIFALWIFWLVAKSLKNVDSSLKEISRNLQSQSKS